MNTMNCLLLGSALLLLTSLCGTTTHADPAYTSGVNVVSPTNGQTFTAFYPNTTVNVPISITNQFVDVRNAAPSTYISVTYSMGDGVSGASRPIGLADDYSGGVVQRLTDMYGHYHRNLYDGSGNLSGPLALSSGNYSVQSQSVITGTTGPGSTTIVVAKFSVDVAS